ncbi:hypothetical protein L1887_36995 [Cichorium endivia]|nr:hypothetical protein L1887_36995 [Cichorium endivia]
MTIVEGCLLAFAVGSSQRLRGGFCRRHSERKGLCNPNSQRISDFLLIPSHLLPHGSGPLQFGGSFCQLDLIALSTPTTRLSEIFQVAGFLGGINWALLVAPILLLL